MPGVRRALRSPGGNEGIEAFVAEMVAQDGLEVGQTVTLRILFSNLVRVLSWKVILYAREGRHFRYGW